VREQPVLPAAGRITAGPEPDPDHHAEPDRASFAGHAALRCADRAGPEPEPAGTELVAHGSDPTAGMVAGPWGPALA